MRNSIVSVPDHCLFIYFGSDTDGVQIQLTTVLYTFVSKSSALVCQILL